jgi:hypothetical protein
MTAQARTGPLFDQEASLSALSRRIAAELTAAALVCRQVEHIVSDLAAEAATPLERLAPLQALDELTQRLGNLAAVLDAVADRSQADWRLEMAPLLAQVRLGDLARRLAGAPAVAPAPGEADIF